MESQIFVIIIVLCVVLIVVGLLKHKYELLINFIMRVFGGIACMVVMNMILASMGTSIQVGINSFTALLSGLLGLPGVAVMYAISTYFHLVV